MDGIPDSWPAPRPDEGPRTIAERIDDALTRLDEFRDRPVVLWSAALVVVALIVGSWWLARPAPERNIEEIIPQVQLETTVAPAASPAVAVVHVSGAVRTPGVYVLDEADRVIDAVTAAGGATVGADLHQLNLAAPLQDGMQIRVPLEGETVITPAAPGSSDGELVDLNRADAAGLENLPGVGPATAASIVQFRDEQGPFQSVEDLLDVPGIGPAKLAGLSDRVVIR